MVDDNADNGMTLDDLFNIEVNQAEVEETLRLGLSPAGTYQTDPAEFGPMTVTTLKQDEKDDSGVVTGQRTLIILTGRGRARVNGKELDGRLRVRLSPDARFKRDRETGEPLETRDSMSNLYAQAVSAYKATYGEKVKNVGDLVRYLSEEPVRYRMIQVGVPTKGNPEPSGEPGNFVIAISPVRRG